MRGSRKRRPNISTAAFPATYHRQGGLRLPHRVRRSISIPASCSRPRRLRPMPMPAPIRRRCASRSGCAATSGGSRIARRRAPTARRSIGCARARRSTRRATSSRRPSTTRRGVSECNPVIIAESTTALKRLSVSEAVMELDLTRRRRSWCSVTLDTAASIWFTAARTATSAGSIRRPIETGRPLTANGGSLWSAAFATSAR